MMVEIPDVAFTSRFRLLQSDCLKSAPDIMVPQVSANVGWVGCSGCAVYSIRCSITQASWMTLSGLQPFLVDVRGCPSIFFGTWLCMLAVPGALRVSVYGGYLDKSGGLSGRRDPGPLQRFLHFNRGGLIQAIAPFAPPSNLSLQ